MDYKQICLQSHRTRVNMVAFDPNDGTFEVTNGAIGRDPKFITNISELWNEMILGTQLFWINIDNVFCA